MQTNIFEEDKRDIANSIFKNCQNIIFCNYGFDLKNGPYLVFDDYSFDYPQRFKIYLFYTENLNFYISNKKFCTGYYDILSGKNFPCPYKKQLLTNSLNCYECKSQIGFFPAFYNSTFENISLKQQKYNLEQHFVYLAFFFNNIIKIGIAHYKRINTRWVEQGARAATIIKKCNSAYIAREYEKIISQKFKIPEKISSTAKLNYLRIPFNFNESNSKLNKIKKDISDKIDIDRDNDNYDLSCYYAKEKLPIFLDNLSILKKTPPILISNYSFIGLIGDILILNKKGNYKLLFLKKLLGYSME